MEATIKHAR